MAKTKIVVIQMKQIIYTALIAGAGIILIILLVLMFRSGSGTDDTQTGQATYKAGTYSARIDLNNTALNLEVTVDPDRIKSVRLVNLSESVTTMFPLIEPSLHEIEAQLKNNIDIEDIALSDNSKYTQTLLINSIKVILDKARI